MNPTIRRIAVSGSAAVALLGGAAAITVVDAPQASAVEMHTVVERAVTAPVNLPDGRTIRITGMGGYGHRATAEHVATVAAWQPGTNPSGTGTQLQTPYNTGQLPANYQQIQAQSSGGYVAAGVVGTLLFGAIAVIRLRSNAHKGDAVLFLFLGVGIGGTAFGAMIHQMTTSGVGSLTGVLSSL